MSLGLAIELIFFLFERFFYLVSEYLTLESTVKTSKIGFFQGWENCARCIAGFGVMILLLLRVLSWANVGQFGGAFVKQVLFVYLALVIVDQAGLLFYLVISTRFAASTDHCRSDLLGHC